MIEAMDQKSPIEPTSVKTASVNEQSGPDFASTLKVFFKRFEGFISIGLFVVGIIGAAALINQFVFQSYYVDGTSMVPTLQNNDRLIIDKVGKTLSNIQSKPYIPARGQIIVLDSSLVDQNGNNEQLVKRVIGLPGDVVVITKDGVVMVKNAQHPDGFNVDESLGLKLPNIYTQTQSEWTIPLNKIFVLGDNRNGSSDSRVFGPVDSSQIQGRLALRIFPFDKAKSFN